MDPGRVGQSQAHSQQRRCPHYAMHRVGEWLPAQAQTDESSTEIKHVEKLMKKKYGIMFHIFGFLGRMRGGANYTAIKIQV
jgi:hypothetical protein